MPDFWGIISSVEGKNAVGNVTACLSKLFSQGIVRDQISTIFVLFFLFIPSDTFRSVARTIASCSGSQNSSNRTFVHKSVLKLTGIFYFRIRRRKDNILAKETRKRLFIFGAPLRRHFSPFSRNVKIDSTLRNRFTGGHVETVALNLIKINVLVHELPSEIEQITLRNISVNGFGRHWCNVRFFVVLIGLYILSPSVARYFLHSM